MSSMKWLYCQCETRESDCCVNLARSAHTLFLSSSHLNFSITSLEVRWLVLMHLGFTSFSLFVIAVAYVYTMSLGASRYACWAWKWSIAEPGKFSHHWHIGKENSQVFIYDTVYIPSNIFLSDRPHFWHSPIVGCYTCFEHDVQSLSKHTTPATKHSQQRGFDIVSFSSVYFSCHKFACD